VVFVGFDPGGARAFGWAILRTAESGTQLLATGTCSCARQALDAVRAAAVQQPRALAVDAPLFWSESGDRKADQYVRRMVCSAGGSSGTVSHVNSLRGACLVQGVLITRMASLVWPHAEISEAHRKRSLSFRAKLPNFFAHSSIGWRLNMRAMQFLPLFSAQLCQPCRGMAGSCGSRRVYLFPCG